MYKKVCVLVLGLSVLFCGFSVSKKEFNYEYEIVLNSNENKDVIQGYIYKEHLINEYNLVISSLEESLVTKAVEANIDRFALEGSRGEYRGGKIIIFIGEAKGDSIKGNLKRNTCDDSNIRVKFFFSKFFVK
jgi:hypothetical protein